MCRKETKDSKDPMSHILDYWLPGLSRREISVELMEDIAADEKLLFETLRDFKGINRLASRVRHVLKTTIIADMKRRNAGEVTFLDIGAGGCDTGLWFARYCRRHGIKCSVYCLDYDPRAHRFASNACRGEPSISFIESDARDIAGLSLNVDYVFTNHFLHHLPDKDIPAMLRAINDCGRYGFVAQDLERHLYWYVGFTVLGSIFWRKGYTFADGRMSIRRGFKRRELEMHVTSAGIKASISRIGMGHWRITNIHR
jgi:2-polyprenyl-3-methyl-5-hydroxy-6-metoxy-1,4-benzoquinol methylase